MNKIAFVSAGLAAMLATFLTAAPARALEFKTFVSSAGNDANPCTRAAPCLSFQAAHDQTAPGGEINCLDSGPFADRTIISKSITIDCGRRRATVRVTCEPSGELGCFMGFVGFSINAPGIVVRIRNLSILGSGGRAGIEFSNGAALFVENCVIRDMLSFQPGVQTAAGINFQPSAPGSQLIVTDTALDANSVQADGGIRVAPSNAGTAGVILDRVRLGRNSNGMVLAGSPIGAFVRDSMVTNSNDGMESYSSTLTIEHTSLVNHGGTAVLSGANSIVRIGDSAITGNMSGVTGTGAAQSFRNNMIAGNAADGTPLTAVPTPDGQPLQ